MTIPDLRVPFVYVEFDSSRAFQGPAILRYKVLLIGNGLAAGTVAEKVITRVTSADQAALYFGIGSVLHKMAETYFANNKINETYMVALDDDGSAVDATGTFAISGTASEDGTAVFYIGGKRIPISVSDLDTADVVGTALVAAITADTYLPVSGANSTGTVTNTAKNGGETGNDIDLRINYQDGEALPAGLSCVVTGMASGATNPDLQDIIDIWGDTWYHIIICPYVDTTNLTAMETELADRWGPQRMIDGLYVSAKADTVANLQTFGALRNSKHVSIIMAESIAGIAWQLAAGYGAQIAVEGQADPARPFQTLQIIGVLPPATDEQFIISERDSLLYDGISTFKVDQSNRVIIERAITMYQKNDAGADDIAYLDVNTLLTLMYLRYDFRNGLLTKFPRSKLADDGTNFGAGQPIVTPAVGKAFAISKFRQWEALGLVEDIDQFINDLIVERSATDPNRLDFILPPDLVNQFRIGGVTIQFLLQGV